MKNLKKEISISNTFKSKHLLVIMTFFCGSAVVSTLVSALRRNLWQKAAGMIVVPFEKSIDGIGSWIGEINQTFQDKQELISKNPGTSGCRGYTDGQNNILIQNQSNFHVFRNYISWMRVFFPTQRLRQESSPGSWKLV